jgi:hypothetical protein
MKTKEQRSIVVGNIDRYSLVFIREMVDVVVVGNIDRYSLFFTREMVDVDQPQQHQPFL